jgi:hypothetical protein
VNGFHVHAIGWILVANARALTPAEAEELTDLWTSLIRIRDAELRAAYPLLRLLIPRSLPLSPATRAAFATLVARMATQHPERFSGPALRQRRDFWIRQVVLGLLLSGLAVLLVPTHWSWAVTAPPTFFLMACGCVLPTVTFWRAVSAIQACGAPGQGTWHLPQKWSQHSP